MQQGGVAGTANLILLHFADSFMPELSSSALPLSSPVDAQSEYRARLADLKTEEALLEREHRLLGYLRLSFAVAVVVLLFPPTPYFLLPVAAFAFAARVHHGSLNRLAETRRAVAFYQHALARVEERWQGLRPRTPRVSANESLYAADLDLFGDASLYELLCEARTSGGEDCLAAWLLAPASPDVARLRQEAIAELRTRTYLREAFARAPGPALAMVSPQDTVASSAKDDRSLRPELAFVSPLLVLAAGLGAWRFASTHSPLWLFASLLVNASLTFALRRPLRDVFPSAQRRARALFTATAMLRALEGERFASPRLVSLQQRLFSGYGSASRALGGLASLTQWVDARANYLVRLLDVPFLYSVQLGLMLGRWQRRHGEALPLWLDTLAEFEALLSLAAYSAEHPTDTFPVFTAEAAVFQAEEIGHPLLRSSICVRNSLSLNRGTPALLVSGSNMSGKSTLLRSVGINAVLAFAGAPVRARHLRLSPFQIAASIQVNDSLQAGKSRFYAEILRLRALTEAAQDTIPLLFVIDEVFAGTNSADRLEGARGLLRALLSTNARGLLSTHDLALTALTGADELSGVRNVHFRDEMQDGELSFDYTLREGPVQRSNGLALMRLIGLQV